MGKMFNGCVLVKSIIQKPQTRDNLNPDFRYIFKYNLFQFSLTACQIESPIVCILLLNIRINLVYYIPLSDTSEP